MPVYHRAHRREAKEKSDNGDCLDCLDCLLDKGMNDLEAVIVDVAQRDVFRMDCAMSILETNQFITIQTVQRRRRLALILGFPRFFPRLENWTIRTAPIHL